MKVQSLRQQALSHARQSRFCVQFRQQVEIDVPPASAQKGTINQLPAIPSLRGPAWPAKRIYRGARNTGRPASTCASGGPAGTQA